MIKTIEQRINAARMRYHRDSGEHWITIGGAEEDDKKHVGGTHVKITESGTIVAGPEGLAKKGIHKLLDFKNKDEHEKKHDRSDSAKPDGDGGHARIDGGGSDPGADVGKQDAKLPGGPKVLTSRPEYTKKPNGSQLAESVTRHLSDEAKHGAELAIESLDKNGGFLLADGTGVGKTRQILAAAKHFADNGHPVLIVAPSEVLKPDWKKKTAEGTYSTDGKLLGIEPKLVKGEEGVSGGEIRMTTYGELDDISRHITGNTIVMFDEAHSLKNSGSKQGSLGMDIAARAKAALFATATPADKPEHLNYMMRAGVFHRMKKDVLFPQLGLKKVEFNNPHTGTTMHKWEIDPKVGKRGFQKRLAVVFDSLTSKGAMIKRELSLEGVGIKSQVIEMPKHVHEEMEQAARTIERESKSNAGLVKAQILGAQRRIQEPYKIPAAVEAVKDALKNGRQAIVFVQRVNDSTVGKSADAEDNLTSGGTAPLLKKALEDAGIHDIAELHGGNKGKGKAAKAMEQFQSGSHKVIIATVESGGTGVNLDDTVGDKPRTTVMMTPPLGATPYMQALGRAHRKSTRSKSNVVNLYGDTEVEKWNRGIIDSKLASLKAITGSDQSLEDNSYGDLSGDEIESMASRGEFKSEPKMDSAKEAKEKSDLDALRRTLGMSGYGPSPEERIQAAKKTHENRESGQSPKTSQEPVAKVHPESKAAIHEALKIMSANDPDRAREINGIGFNKFDGEFGSDLAGKDALTDRQAHAAAKMLRKYKGQLPSHLYEHIANPKTEETQETPASAPAAEKEQATPSVPHQKHLDLVNDRASDKQAIRFRGNTFAQKDAIKALGAKVGSFAKWDPDRKVWRMEPHWAKDKEALAKGLHELDKKGVEAYQKSLENRVNRAIKYHAAFRLNGTPL